MRQVLWTTFVGLTLVAGATTFAGCLAGGVRLVGFGEWSDSGYRSPWDNWMAGLGVGGAIVLAVFVVLLAANSDGDITVPQASGLILLLAMIAALSTVPVLHATHQIDVADSGFLRAEYKQGGDTDLTLYNAGDRPVTVCIGTAGDCDSATKGARRLRSPGATVVPGGHAVIRLPNVSDDYRLTIVDPGPAVVRRDTVLHTSYSAPSTGMPKA